MSVLDRKLRREVRANRGLLWGVTSIIAVGVMCFIYMRSSYFNLSRAQYDYYAQCRMADFWIDLKQVPLAELGRVENVPGIIQLQSRIKFAATVDLEDVREPINSLVLSLPDRRIPVLNDIVLRRGSYFTGERPNEVIVSDAFARARKIVPGDAIHVILNQRKQALHVVGTAISSEFTYLLAPGAIAPDPKSFGVLYVPRTFAEESLDMQGAANQLVGRLAPEVRTDPQAILDQIEQLLAPYGVQNAIARKDQASHMFLNAEITGLGVFATVMPTIFLAVAALVLNVLMSRMIEGQRTVIGTLKALGYRDPQIFGHYLKFGMLVGVGGGILGCALGYGMAIWVTSIYLEFYEFPNLQNQIYPGTYFMGIALSVGCALVGTVHGARLALALRPAEAMRPRAPAAGAHVWLERMGWLWSRLAFGWRLALRSALRNRVRTSVGLFAASTGASVLVFGLMASAAMRHLVDFQFEKVTRSDYDLQLVDERSYQAVREAQRLPGVDYAEPLLTVSCNFRHGHYRERGAVTGLIPAAQLTTPRDTAGNRLEIPADGLLLTQHLADLLHVQAGDMLTIEPTRGLRRPVQAPVAQIAQSYLGTAVYTEIGYLNRLIGEERTVSGVQLAHSRDPLSVDQFYRQLKQMPAIQSVTARTEVARNLNETIIKTQSIFIFLLTMFAGVIFFGSVMSASLVSLAERMREVSTLCVLGYGPWQIGGLLLRESMLVNMLGSLLGLPLGYSLYLYVSRLYDTDVMRLPVYAPAWVWVVTLALAVAFTLGAQLMVQWKIHHLNWLLALQGSE